MGNRLTLHLIEKKEWERCKASDAKSLYDLDVNIIEEVMYDWCTDAFEDIYHAGHVHRLTPQKLDEECDIYVGVMDEESFKHLIKRIYEIASKFNHDWEQAKYAMRKTEDKYTFGFESTWHGAYYNAIHIWKIIDWEKYVLYAEIS